MYAYAHEPWFYHTNIFLYTFLLSLFLTPLFVYLLGPKPVRMEQQEEVEKKEERVDTFKKFMEEKRLEKFKDAPLAKDFIKEDNKQKTWEDMVKDSEFFVGTDDENNIKKTKKTNNKSNNKQIKNWTTGMYYNNNNNNDITI